MRGGGVVRTPPASPPKESCLPDPKPNILNFHIQGVPRNMTVGYIVLNVFFHNLRIVRNITWQS